MEKEQHTNKPLDTVLFVKRVLKRLGSGKLESLSDRVKTQKIQYFAQVFGISPSYTFNLYIRGPYSPQLAHDMFTVGDTDYEIYTSKFASEDLEERFQKLKSAIGGKSSRELEIATTLHWLKEEAKLTPSKVVAELKILKSASASEISSAHKLLKNLRK